MNLIIKDIRKRGNGLLTEGKRKKRIVFISEYFYPINYIASIRATKLSKYLSIYDYEVIVVCRSAENFPVNPENEKEIGQVASIYRVCNSTISRRIKEERNRRISIRRIRNLQSIEESLSIKSNQIKLIINYLRKFINVLENYDFIPQAKKILRKIYGIDILITSYGPKSNSILGKWYKKKHPEVFWIADHRDPVFNLSFTLPIFRTIDKTFVRRVCRNANVVTGVSQGCIDNLFLSKQTKQVVLTNGFDRDDIENINHQMPAKFTLAYLGSLYSGKRDLTPLFKVFRDLIFDSKIVKGDVEICYSGSSRIEILRLAESFKLSEIINATDNITHEESLKRQLESHMLILSTWNNIGEEGVITGKFLEYMMMGKPIIALVSGNLKNSEVKKMMIEGDLGFCYEEPTGKNDEVLLKQYILNQYTNYKNVGSVDYAPNHYYIEKFNYQNITNQLISLFPNSLQH